MTTGTRVRPDSLPTCSIAATTSIPDTTFPKTTCFPSNHGVSAVHRKNWDPFVSFPALAMLNIPGPVCFNLKFSSANLSPYIDSPPGGRIENNNKHYGFYSVIDDSSLNNEIDMIRNIVPRPFPFVISPPWHMNPGITRWKGLPLKCIILPDLPTPFSPVHKHLKFSAVSGTTSARNSISIRPLADPPMVMSKNTTGLLLASVAAELMVRL